MQWHKPAVLMLAVTGVFALGACSSFEVPTKKIDYKSTAAKLPTLEVPPDLTRPSTDDRFLVPDINPKGTATFSDYSKDRAGKPQVSSAQAMVLPNIENVRVERAGTQRWLVVPGTPDKIWLVIKDFWQETGFIVNVETPEAGVMETDWAENRAKIPQDWLRSTLGKLIDQIYSTAERDKFRTRLERNEDGGSEVYISHRGLVEVYRGALKDTTGWEARPADPQLEAEFLSRLLTKLGVKEEQAKAAVSNANAAPARARFESVDELALARVLRYRAIGEVGGRRSVLRVVHRDDIGRAAPVQGLDEIGANETGRPGDRVAHPLTSRTALWGLPPRCRISRPRCRPPGWQAAPLPSYPRRPPAPPPASR